MDYNMDLIPCLKIADGMVYIKCTSSDPVIQQVQHFRQLNLFCDLVLQAKCEKIDSETQRDHSLRYRKRLRKSMVPSKKKDQEEIKWEDLSVHSCIVATRSKTLKNRILKLVQGKINNVCTINDVNMKYLRICIDFLYRQPVSFSTEEVCDVLNAARTLGISDLQHWCKAAGDSIHQTHASKSFDLSVGNLNIKTEEGIQQQQQANSKIPQLNQINDISLDKIIPSEKKKLSSNIEASLEHKDIKFEINSVYEYKDPVLETYEKSNESDNDGIGINDSIDDDNDDDYDEFWEMEKMEDLNTVKWNVNFEDQNDSEPEYLGNPPLTVETDLEPVKLYTCFYCGEDFSSADHFCDKVGKKVRLRMKYCCHYCGVLISTRHFAIHIRAHMQIKNYKCNICDYAAVSKFRVAEHQRKHSTNKQYRCEICGKTYKYPSALREHKVVAHNVRSDYPFKQKRELLYQCPECEFKCSAHGIAIRHVKTKHPNCNSEEMQHFIEVHRKKQSTSTTDIQPKYPNDEDELIQPFMKIQTEKQSLTTQGGEKFNIKRMKLDFNESVSEHFVGENKSFLGECSSFVGDSDSRVCDNNSHVGENSSHVGDYNSQAGENNSHVGDYNSHVVEKNSQIGDYNSHVDDDESSSVVTKNCFPLNLAGQR